MTDGATTLFPVSVKGVVIVDDQVLLLKNERDEWELPGGKLELGEDPTKCLAREIAEETGLTVEVHEPLDSWQYHIRDGVDVLIVTYRCAAQSFDLLKISDEHTEMATFGLAEVAALNMPAEYQASIKTAARARQTNWNQPVVGVGVMVLKDGKVLLGQRQSSSTHGHGEHAWPGGKLDHLESIEECAKREVFEETGVEITNVRFLRLMNMKAYAPKHFVDIAMVADWAAGEPEVKEPQKMNNWGWYDPDHLPEPLFATLPTYFTALKTGRNFWDE